MATQQHLFPDGSIRQAEYWSAPSREKQIEVVKKALTGYLNSQFVIKDVDEHISQADITIDSNTITVYFTTRSLSGGGRAETKGARPGRPNECRMQISPSQYNRLVKMNSTGKNAYLIGVYINDTTELLAVLKAESESKGKPDGSISKQVHINTLAKAQEIGLSKQPYPHSSEVVYAMRPELFKLFLLSEVRNNELVSMPAIEEGSITNSNLQRNLIFFGAPGTGKSHKLKDLSKQHFAEGNIRRITFHPDYTYAQFVGCYKPTEIQQPKINSDGKQLVDGSGKAIFENVITYNFVPGPLLLTYISAIKDPTSDYLLVIEEINRANPAAAFGDIIQLLDRKNNGWSEYDISTPEEMRSFLKIKLMSDLANGESFCAAEYLSEEERIRHRSDKIALPPNMYIWATMNSADQGVFPMDTAFKRRWEFRYIGIDDGSNVIRNNLVPVGTPTKLIRWDDLRRSVNKVLLAAGINEDKLLGPFFISPSQLREQEKFSDIFKSKVLLYLFEDAAKMRLSKVFSIEEDLTYSNLCSCFDEIGERIFKGMDPLEAIDPKPTNGETPERSSSI